MGKNGFYRVIKGKKSKKFRALRVLIFEQQN